MSAYGLGHNSRALPTPIDTSADIPRDIPRMHYFKCDIDALWDVIFAMPLDLGGFYMRALLAMYKHMEGLPADDDVARMRLGNIDIRTYRRLKAALLERPKCLVERPSGRLSNERFEEEITSYVTEFKNRRAAAIERESKRRHSAVSGYTSRGLPGRIGQKFPESRSEVSPVLAESSDNLTEEVGEKVNENNGHTTTTLAQGRHNGNHSGGLRARVIRVKDIEGGRDSEPLLLSQNPDSPLSETAKSPSASKRRHAYTEAFEQFWRAYPDKTNNSKTTALSVWQRLSVEDRALAVASLSAYTAYCRAHPDYRPLHAERYLKQRRFEAYAPGQGGSVATGWWQNAATVQSITPERWRKAIGLYANGVWLIDKLGPPPGTEGCVVPAELVVELQLAGRYDALGNPLRA